VLTVRTKQMRALAALMKGGFEKRMVSHLRSSFPKLTAAHADEQLFRFVRFGVERAAAYGIAIERDVARYVEYMVQYGPRFDTDPRFAWAQKLLSAPGASGSAKMDRIEHYDQLSLRSASPAPSRAEVQPARGGSARERKL